MKPIILIIVFISGMACTINSWGQLTTGPTTATYARTADFFLRYANEKGGVPFTLEAEYFSKERYFRLAYATPNEAAPFKQLLILTEPLNYEYFYRVLNDSLKKIMPAIQPLANSTVQDVFTWLYALTAGTEDNIVKAADVCLKRWIYTFGIDHADVHLSEWTNYQHREKTIDSITNKYQSLDLQVNTMQRLFDSTLSQRLDLQIDVRKEKEAEIKAENALLESKRELSNAHKSTSGIINTFNVQNEDYKNDSTKHAKLADLVGKLKTLVTAASIQLTKDSLKKVQDSIETENKTLISVLNKKKKSLDSLTDVLKPALVNEKAKSADTLEKFKAVADSKEQLDTKKATLLETHQNVIDSLTGIIRLLRIGLYTDSAKFSDDANNLNRDKVIVTDSIITFKVKRIGDSYFRIQQQLQKLKEKLGELNIHHVNRVSLQFERGFLERIQVYVDNGYGGEHMFENVFAIGMTSINNLKYLSRYKLYLRPWSHKDYIILGDVIGNYDNYLDLFTRDYSPADTVLNNINPSATPCITLHKARLVNLFDAKIYTDLEGLRADQPNGLIQIEAQRRFNIWTHRFQSGNRMDFNFFSNMVAYGALTKIEQKDLRLPLYNQGLVVNKQVVSPSYATTLDFRRWENTSFGLDLNAFLFDAPDEKLTAYLNFGVRYGHTSLADSTRTITAGGIIDSVHKPVFLDAHSITWQLPSISLELFSERRVGLILSYQYNMTRFYSNNNFKPIVSYAKSDLNTLPIEKFAHYYHMFELFLRVETSQASNGKIFLRARYFMQRGDVNTFFPQIQLGYAYNLLFRK